MNFLKKALIFLVALHSLTGIPVAQRANGEERDIFRHSLGDLTLVGGLGIAGGVMGLSLLSFVDRPQDHLNYVVLGTAVGIILGVGFVAFSQATKAYGKVAQYGDGAPSREFHTLDRIRWGRSSLSAMTPPPALAWGWNWRF